MPGESAAADSQIREDGRTAAETGSGAVSESQPSAAPAARRGKNLVVTIGRQYGSGGREIGERLARLLGVAYYDKKLVTLAAEKSGFSAETFVHQNEKVPRGFAWLFSYASFTGMSHTAGVPLDDQLFVAQASAIRDIAREGSCVIVGRCADYVLDDMRDELDVVDVFLHSTDEARVARVARRNGLTPEEARDRIKQIAPRRAAYYERYTDRKWGDVSNFDLCMNTALVDPEGAARTIVDYLVARRYITRAELPLCPGEPRDLGEEDLYQAFPEEKI